MVKTRIKYGSQGPQGPWTRGPRGPRGFGTIKEKVEKMSKMSPPPTPQAKPSSPIGLLLYHHNMILLSRALRAYPATVPHLYFLESWSLFSKIFLILGHQIRMILSDFGSPGAHFLMIFKYFGCLGTPFGGLEHILIQGSDFYDFGDLSATKN